MVTIEDLQKQPYFEALATHSLYKLSSIDVSPREHTLKMLIEAKPLDEISPTFRTEDRRSVRITFYRVNSVRQ